MVVQERSAPSTSNVQAIPQYVTGVTTSSLPMFRNATGQIQYIQNNMGQIMMTDPNNPGQAIMVPVQLNGTGGGVVHMSQEQLNQLQQNDGEGFIPDLENAEVSIDLNAGTLVIDTSSEAKIGAVVKKMKDLQAKKPTRKFKKVNLAMMIPQVDGGGPHMSDSSSDEEDDDAITRMVNNIDDKGENEDDDDAAGDEGIFYSKKIYTRSNFLDPLNSDDDQSDDEDLDTLFESPNIIVCQFEKVKRNFWCLIYS